MGCTVNAVMAAVQDVKELVAWQLADELRIRSLEFATRPGVREHVRYRDRLADAAALGPHLIAEGFERVEPKEFARRVRAARTAEQTLLALFGEGRRRGLLTERECGECVFLARRAVAAATALIRYLEHAGERAAFPWTHEEAASQAPTVPKVPEGD